MVWVLISTSLKLGDHCRHASNNYHMATIRERLRSEFQEKPQWLSVGYRKQTAGSYVKHVLLTHLSTADSSLWESIITSLPLSHQQIKSHNSKVFRGLRHRSLTYVTNHFCRWFKEESHLLICSSFALPNWCDEL